MSVIINPRGTSGSGKTELVRRILAGYGWQWRTDGESRSGSPPLAAAQQAREEGVPVFTVAIAAQPPLELQQIAEISGGQAFTAPTSEQLTAVYRDLGTRLTYVEEKRELTSYFMAGAAALLLAGAAASIAWFLRLP